MILLKEYLFRFLLGIMLISLSLTLSAQIQTEPLKKVQFESVGLKKNFQLIITFHEAEMAKGFVRYKGQEGQIPIRYLHSEIIQNREEEGRPNEREIFYDEIYNNKISGTYSLIVQGAIIYGASYTRKKDNKTFILNKIE